MNAIVRAAVAMSVGLGLARPDVEPASSGTPGRGPGAPLASAVAEPLGVFTLRAPASRMILVPASTFVMGSTDDDVMAALVDCQREPAGHRCDATHFANETPPHEVHLSAFWLDRTEVTVADYARCVARGRCRALPFAGGARRFDRPTFPASMVTWNEAAAFCESIDARLPTEAEFERAARGVDGRRYPWGNLFDSRMANHGRLAWDPTDASDGFVELAPVGSFPSGKTPDGFLDLAGNASEWVSDRYAPQYDAAETVDPAGPPASLSLPARVIRGGGYADPAARLRGAARFAEDAGTRRPWVGFRCARSGERRGGAKAR